MNHESNQEIYFLTYSYVYVYLCIYAYAIQIGLFIKYTYRETKYISLINVFDV